jgi:hypothetical protein
MPVTHRLLPSLGSSLLQLPSLVKQPYQNYFQASTIEFWGGIFVLLKNKKLFFRTTHRPKNGLCIRQSVDDYLRTALKLRQQFIGISRRGKVVKPIIYRPAGIKLDSGQGQRSPSDLSTDYARRASQHNF